MIRRVKVGLIFTVSLWGFVGALGNILDWNQALGAVATVTSMTSFEGGSESWQATTNPVLWWLGAFFIVGSKLTTGVLCAVGGARMWASRNGGATDFNFAKSIALAGCGVAIIMLFGGFMVVAESWFELWRSEQGIRMALTDAFRYAGMIALVAMFVAGTDE